MPYTFLDALWHHRIHALIGQLRLDSSLWFHLEVSAWLYLHQRQFYLGDIYNSLNLVGGKNGRIRPCRKKKLPFPIRIFFKKWYFYKSSYSNENLHIVWSDKSSCSEQDQDSPLRLPNDVAVRILYRLALMQKHEATWEIGCSIPCNTAEEGWAWF